MESLEHSESVLRKWFRIWSKDEKEQWDRDEWGRRGDRRGDAASEMREEKRKTNDTQLSFWNTGKVQWGKCKNME